MRNLLRVIAAGLLIPAFICAENNPVDLTVRGAIGTDLSLGLAYGVGLYHKVVGAQTSYEIGANFYGSHNQVTTQSTNVYNEVTDLSIVTVMYNLLHNYDPDGKHLYLITGVGIGLIGYNWTESSPTDISLGTLLPGGGSTHSLQGTAFGNMINLGFGKMLANGLDLRAEMPIIVMYSSYTGSTAVAIALTVSVGKAFTF